MKQLIVDSSCELTDDMIKSMECSVVPFIITMDGKDFIDDENLNMETFFETMDNSSDVIRTACPSPDEFLKRMKGDEIYVVTITSKLSGAYQSAMIAKQMYLEKHPEAKVHVFDSKSATAGETGVALIVDELVGMGKSFEEVVAETEKKIDESITLIALSSLNNLARNGRLPRIVGKLSKVLNIRLIARNKDGEISPLSIERGLKRTLNSLIKKCEEYGNKVCEYAIVISQANAVEVAVELKNRLMEMFPSRPIEITSMKGLSSTYAEEGGVVVFL